MNNMLSRVYAIRLMTNHETECDEFLQICEALSNDLRPETLADAFKVFSDRTEHHEVMLDLQHYVELFAEDIYVPALLKALPGMQEDARDWSISLLVTALTTPSFILALERFVTADDVSGRRGVRYAMQHSGRRCRPTDHVSHKG